MLASTIVEVGKALSKAVVVFQAASSPKEPRHLCCALRRECFRSTSSTGCLVNTRRANPDVSGFA